MKERELDTIQLHILLDRMRKDDPEAPNELIIRVCGRLERMARKMLHGDRVHRWEQTEELLQNALIRLMRALKTETPASMRGFYGLAGTHIRLELLDLARRHYQPHKMGANHASQAGRQDPEAPFDAPDKSAFNPLRLAQEAEYMEKVEHLPDDLREIFTLSLYSGLTHQEIAQQVGVCVSTIERAMARAKRKLGAMLSRNMPSAAGEE